MQRFTTPKGLQAAPGDTAAHAFPSRPAAYVYLSTPAGNAGTVTITDAGGSGGLVLGAGVGVTIPVVVIGPILNLDSLSYKMSNGADVLNYLVLS